MGKSADYKPIYRQNIVEVAKLGNPTYDEIKLTRNRVITLNVQM